MARLTLTVEMKNIYEYTRSAYGRYGTETAYIYNMVAEDGTVYVWKTTAFMCINIYEGIDPDKASYYDSKGRACEPQRINPGDVIKIAATVKGQSEYNGQPQTELTRVTIKERLVRGRTPEEIRAEKQAERLRRKQEQLDSIKDGDIVWRMPYQQYKEHYSDCETVIDSYQGRDKGGRPSILVIIREGRLKANGTRGKHYNGYRFKFSIGGKTYSDVFRAVSEETAAKQLMSKHKGATDIELDKIYLYD